MKNTNKDFIRHIREKLNHLLLIKTNKEESVLDALVKSSFLNLISKIFGYFKNIAIAVLLGFGVGTDSYFMAFSLLGIFLMFSDVFDSIGVPQLVKARQTSEDEYKRLAGLLLTLTTTLSITLTLLAFILLPVILKIPAGFSHEAIKATQICYILLLPYLLSRFFFQHFGAVLRSKRQFTAYSIAEFIQAVLHGIMVIGGLLLYKRAEILSIAFSLSQLISTIILVIANKELIHFAFYINKSSKKILKQFFQLSILYGVFHLYILVDRAFASYLSEKSITALAYGLKFSDAIKSILKVENIAITSLCEAGGSLDKLNFYSKKLLYITIPVTIFLSIFAEYVVKLLLNYGAFSNLDITLTAEALRYYSFSIFFMFLWPLIYRVLQIREKLLVIGVLALVGVVLNGILNYTLVFIFDLGIKGICLGTFGAYIFLCASGYLLVIMSQDSQKTTS